MSLPSNLYSIKLHDANHLFRQGEIDDSLKLVKQLLSEDQNQHETQFLSALIHATKKDFIDAKFHFKKSLSFTRNKENLLNTHLNIAQCHLHLAEIPAAIKEYLKNLDLQSEHLQSWFGLAECYTRLGNKIEACKAYQQVIEYSQINTDSYIKSIAYQAVSELYPELNNSEDKFSMSFRNQLNHDIRICSDQAALVSLHFSVAKILERQQCFQTAFKSYQIGNEVKSQMLNYHHQPVKLEAQKIIQYFEKNSFENTLQVDNFDCAPIFIVGLPRSNSTLIESLLSCSIQTKALGETTHIPEMIQLLNQDNRYPEILSDLNENEFLRIRNLIVEKYQMDSEVVIIDKLPANFWNVGLIKKLFPNSKIIHCYKDPVEACLSLFRQNFLEGHPYAYSLKDSADYYDLHIELMEHWKALFPNQIHSLNYVDFIENPEQQAVKIFEYCQLAWDPNYLTEYMNRKNVTTASSFQVRTKIHSNSSDLVQKYLPQLDYLVNRYTMAP